MRVPAGEPVGDTDHYSITCDSGSALLQCSLSLLVMFFRQVEQGRARLSLYKLD